MTRKERKFYRSLLKSTGYPQCEPHPIDWDRLRKASKKPLPERDRKMYLELIRG